MIKAKTKPSAGVDWTQQLSDLFKSTNPELDQVKKSIQSVQEDLKRLHKSGKLDSLAANLKRTAEEGFKLDLVELGITDEAAQEEHLLKFNQAWDQLEMDQKYSEIINSPELAAMDGFISHVENLPKLKKVMESAEPESTWKTMLKGLTKNFPELGKYLGALAPLLSAFGIDLSGKKKKEEKKKKAPDKKPDDKKKADKKKSDEKKEKAEDEKPQGPLDGPEIVPEDFKPGKTLVMGDSNYSSIGVGPYKSLKERLNATMLSKGGMQSGWLANEKLKGGAPNPNYLGKKPKEFFKDFEYAVIGFGSNDMGNKEDWNDVWERIKNIINILKTKNPKIKVIIATIPPCKGNIYGQWRSDFKGVEEKRAKIREAIKKAKREGLIAEVMDLAAKKKHGGLAENGDPETLAMSCRNTSNDVAHAKPSLITTAIRRAQYRARNKAT